MSHTRDSRRKILAGGRTDGLAGRERERERPSIIEKERERAIERESELYQESSQTYKHKHKHLIIQMGRRSLDGCSDRDGGVAASQTLDSRLKIPADGLVGWLAGREREQKQLSIIEKERERARERARKKYSHDYKFFSHTIIQTETQSPYNPKGAAFPRWMFW